MRSATSSSTDGRGRAQIFAASFAVHALLVSTTELSRELTALVRQSRADLSPALAHVENTLAVLTKNEDNVDSALRLLAPFVRVFTNVTGNGPWLDGYVMNLPPG